MTASSVYLDSSALVKLVLDEPESAALLAWLRAEMFLTSSALARTEVIRSVQAAGDAALERGRELVRRLELVALDDAVLDSAAVLQPSSLRSLDAIHLASASALGDELLAVITYDQRMLAAARALGLPVALPGIDGAP